MFAVNPPVAEGQKPVMGVVGFGVQHGVEPGEYRIQDVPDYGKLLSLIEENRIDAAYIVLPDVEQLEGGADRVRQYVGKVETRWQGTDGVLCWKAKAEAVAKMTEAFQEWKANGRLRSMLGPYYVE